MYIIQTIGAKYGGAGGASAPPTLSDRSAGGARMCKVVQGCVIDVLRCTTGTLGYRPKVCTYDSNAKDLRQTLAV